MEGRRSIAGRPGRLKDELEKLSFAFEGEKLLVTERGKTETGSFAVDPKKDPATIDLIGPKGEKIAGIYKFDKDGKLTMVFTKEKDARSESLRRQGSGGTRSGENEEVTRCRNVHTSTSHTPCRGPRRR